MLYQKFQAILVFLCFCLLCIPIIAEEVLDATYARIRALNLDGTELAYTTIEIPGSGFIPTWHAMKMLNERGTLKWTYAALGGKPVVDSIMSIRSTLPTTAWILTLERRGKSYFNIGMSDMEVKANDLLIWKLWKVTEIGEETGIAALQADEEAEYAKTMKDMEDTEEGDIHTPDEL